ncbi:MAG: GrdX family protein [Oscillospiraceae bacterium]|nr:GrdX family protein [Oscillospiraceae bacterium]
MYEDVFLITNNPMVRDFLTNLVYKFIIGNTIDVYKEARDMIRMNYCLLCHPLASSLKPNETPYRTVVLSTKPKSTLDLDSLMYIEKAIDISEKFLKIKPLSIEKFSEKLLNDFQVVDFSIIENAIKK